jgi:hypothetical protein
MSLFICVICAIFDELFGAGLSRCKRSPTLTIERGLHGFDGFSRIKNKKSVLIRESTEKTEFLTKCGTMTKVVHHEKLGFSTFFQQSHPFALANLRLSAFYFVST